MHEVINTNRHTRRSLPTTSGRVSLAPGQKQSFAPGALSAGMLRILSLARSDLKLRNLSPEAERLAKDANSVPPKKRGFAIVHGAGDITVEEALRREKLRREPAQVRDEFDAAQRAARKTQANLQDPPMSIDEESEQRKEHDDGEPDLRHDHEKDQSGEGGGGETEAQKTERVRLEQPQKTGRAAELETLIGEVESDDISMKALRLAAKGLLGDDYPPGAVGKEDILAALKKAAKKA